MLTSIRIEQDEIAGLGRSIMKNTKKIIVAGALCLTAGAFAFVQNHLTGRGLSEHGGHLRAWHHSEPGNSGGATAVARHLAEGLSKVVEFDINKDRQLDEAERGALARAIAEGRLRFAADH